jgi:hypothetical protein
MFGILFFDVTKTVDYYFFKQLRLPITVIVTLAITAEWLEHAVGGRRVNLEGHVARHFV